MQILLTHTAPDMTICRKISVLQARKKAQRSA